jgi:hypothetical protein
MLWCEFEHLVQMTNRSFQAPPFCGDPRQQQKNFGLVIAMGQELQILFFCLLEISTGMMSRSAPQEFKENWKSLAIALIGRHVPAFTLDGCGEKQHPKKGMSQIRLRVAALESYRRSPEKFNAADRFDSP